MDANAVADVFASFGPVAVKRMFGGQGIFADGLMIGLIFNEMIYLRSDAETRAAFTADGSVPFEFGKPSAGKTISIGYYSLPDRLYEDGEELAHWARKALAAALAKQKTVRPSAKRTARKATKA